MCVYTGRVSDVAQELVAVTQQCLQAAIDVCGPGVPFRAIGEAISSVADAAGEVPGSKDKDAHEPLGAFCLCSCYTAA